MGLSPLSLAVRLRSMEGVRFLTDMDADVNVIDRSGQPPLTWAARYGLDEIAKLLIQKGAHVNPAVTGSGLSEVETPLSLAVEKGHVAMVQTLLSNGATSDYSNAQTGQTLLHLAVLSGRLEIVRSILECGLDVNAIDHRGYSALDYARVNEHWQVADLIENYGAKTTRETNVTSDVRGLMKGEATVWYLKNRGWAVKTVGHNLVFDAEEYGVARPTEPSLANGFITPEELGDREVIALFTNYYGEPGEPAYVHELENRVDQISYIHNEGDSWRGSDKTRYLKAGGSVSVGDVDVDAIDVMTSMTSLGYLISVDGITLFYAGFRPEHPDEYMSDLKALFAGIDRLDIAFLPIMSLDASGSPALSRFPRAAADRTIRGPILDLPQTGQHRFGLP